MPRWKRPGGDSGTENLIIKISQTRHRNCVFGKGRSCLGIMFVFALPPPPGGGLCSTAACLCVNTNIDDAFARAPLLYDGVLIRRWKTQKKLLRKKNKTRTGFFYFTGHCDYTVFSSPLRAYVGGRCIYICSPTPSSLISVFFTLMTFTVRTLLADGRKRKYRRDNFLCLKKYNPLTHAFPVFGRVHERAPVSGDESPPSPGATPRRRVMA